MGMGMIGRALAAGVAGATGSLANSYGMQAKMQMEEEKQKRMAEFASQMRREEDDYAWNKKVERAPQETEMAVTRETAVGKAREMSKLDPEVAEARRTGEEADARAKLKFDTDTLKDRVRILRAEAEAKRDPADRQVAALRLKEAELRLAEAEDQRDGRTKVRGLRGAAVSVDLTQPGAEQSRRFYEDEASRAVRSDKVAQGGDPSHRGQIKVGKDDNGSDVMVFDDGKGGVFKLDPKSLPTYGEGGKASGAKVFPASKLEAYARQKGQSVAAIKAELERNGWSVQ